MFYCVLLKWKRWGGSSADWLLVVLSSGQTHGERRVTARDLEVLIEKTVKGREKRTRFPSKQCDLLESASLRAKAGKAPMYSGCQCCDLSVILQINSVTSIL